MGINVRHADSDNDREKYLLIWKDGRPKTEVGRKKTLSRPEIA